jgi:catalase
VAEPPMPVEQDAWIKRYDTTEAEDYYQQAGDLFRLMNESQKINSPLQLPKVYRKQQQRCNKKCLNNLIRQIMIMHRELKL